MPVGKLVSSTRMNDIKEYYKNLGPDYVKALNDMIVFDAVIYNTDRHFGNFGFLINNETNEIAAPAPLFDHGNSLFNYAGSDDMESIKTLKSYADTLYPCVYNDFVEEAKKAMTPVHREALRHLLSFKFRKHSHYNLPNDRLTLIEEQIRLRAEELLN